jgi:hypothetical protein
VAKKTNDLANVEAMTTMVLAALFLHARISNPQQTAVGTGISIDAAFDDAEAFIASARTRLGVDPIEILVDGP